MGMVYQYLAAHHTAVALVLFWLGSNFVSALPSPTNASGGFYKFVFAFAHGLSGSLPRIFPSTRVFNDPTRGSQTYFSNGAPNGANVTETRIDKP